MSLGIRYKFHCDDCGRVAFVPRASTYMNARGEVMPVGDVLCKGCARIDAAIRLTLRVHAGRVSRPKAGS